MKWGKDSHNSIVAPANASNPISSGTRLEDDLSAYHPAKGDPINNAAPYTDKRIDT